MADPLSLTASIIAVIEISTGVLSCSYRYVSKVRGAENDVIKLINAVTGLKGILSDLRGLIETESDNVPHRLKTLEGPLEICTELLKELYSKLGPAPQEVKLFKALVWPFKEKELLSILERLEKQKSTMILVLAGDNLRATLAVEENVYKIQKSFEKLATGQEREKVLSWLMHVNPSTNHRAARSKYEPNTGVWLLESESFISWTASSKNSLWLHGIPGAGKTILCSTVIAQIEELCSSEVGYECVYFYFDFNEPRKQVLEAMLQSVIAQLCCNKPVIPVEVQALYDNSRHGVEQPTEEGLLSTLRSLLQKSHKTFVILDALDECSERPALLNVLIRLINGNEPLNLLVTSRKERDIDAALKNVVDVEIGIQNDKADADIKIHVSKCLSTDERLKRWDQLVKDEILESLVSGAHGMYTSQRTRLI